MAQLSPSILLSSTFSCLVCNKNINNLSFNIYTTFLSKSKDISIHTKIIQIVGNYNFNDKIYFTHNVLCMICFKILETIDILECELKKQKNKFESQFRKSVEVRRNEANQQPILTNQIRDSIERHNLGAYNNADDIIEPVNPISGFQSQIRKIVEVHRNEAKQQPIITNRIRDSMDRHSLDAYNNADNIIEPVNPISGDSSERVNDILSSFLATTEGNSQDSSADLTSEQFISSLRTTDSPSRIHFNQNECRDDLAQPIIEKLFTDDTGLNIIQDNEDTVNTITITERQADSEIHVETVIESKSREMIESKALTKCKNSNNSLKSSPEDVLENELKIERKNPLDAKTITRNKEKSDLSGHFIHAEDNQDDLHDLDNPDDSGSTPNDTPDYQSIELNDTEKCNSDNKTTNTIKKRKRKQDHETFSKTKKEDTSSVKHEPDDPSSPVVEQDFDDWDLSTSTNSCIEKTMTFNPFSCDLCDKQFSTSVKLAKHCEDIHSHILCHVCSDCGVRYKEKAKLTRHMVTMHKVNPHHCQGCDYQAKSQNALDKHILDKHPKSKFFECDICCKKFSTHRYLHVVHMKRCHFGLPIKYRCEICNKGFVDKTAIDNHKLIHSDIKDHTCEFCGASFRSPYSLRVHRNIHTEEIKYPCGDCDAKFLRNTNLIAHKKRYHNSGDGKLVCEICGNSFLIKRDLQRHQDTMHPNVNGKPLICGICEKTFYSKEKYKNHQKTHTVCPKYQCSLCPQVFARKAFLLRHMTSLHYTKTRIIESKQNFMVNKNNMEQDSINKKIHVNNLLLSEDNSCEKESVVIIVNNLEVNHPLSVFNIGDQVSDKSNNSHTLIPQTVESPQNVKDITSINQNHIKNLIGTKISLPTPILFDTIEDNDPLQLNTEEEITSENANINYQEYINGVTLQSAACISLDSENLEVSHQNNFSSELLSGSRVLVPESSFTLITEDVNAVEKQTPSLILTSKDIHNYSKQTSVLLSNQDDVNSGTLSTSTWTSKDIHNYSKQAPILKLTSDVSDSNSRPFSTIMLTNEDVNNESTESSILTLGKDINSSMGNKNVSNSSRQPGGPFTKLSLSTKDSRNCESESLSALTLPSDIVNSESVEKTLPLTLVSEDEVVEKIDVKEHNISLSFSAVEGDKEQHLVTEWF